MSVSRELMLFFSLFYLAIQQQNILFFLFLFFIHFFHSFVSKQTKYQANLSVIYGWTMSHDFYMRLCIGAHNMFMVHFDRHLFYYEKTKKEKSFRTKIAFVRNEREIQNLLGNVYASHNFFFLSGFNLNCIFALLLLICVTIFYNFHHLHFIDEHL